jgi:radical SAM superfamily enzyme YgiQ (UPF0313 family)
MKDWKEPKEIVLIKPRSILSMSKYPPLSLATLASTLKGNVRIIDTQIDKIPNLNNVDLVGISMMTSEIPSAIEIIKNIKGPRVVIGGIHATLFPEQVAKIVDNVVVGEGEYFTEHLDEKIIKMPLRDLESLPVPDWDKVNLKRYKKDIPYESSRGCPNRCKFCVNSIIIKPYRAKSAEKVLRDLKILKEKYDIEHIHFVDDNFFVDLKRALKIAKGMKKLKLKWFGECRADYIAKWGMKIINFLEDCGCDSLTVGIESGSQRILDMVNKQITLKDALQCAKKIGMTNIVPAFSFIIGFPNETENDRKLTLKMIKYVKHLCPQCIIGLGVFWFYPKMSIIELDYPKNIEDWTDYIIKKFTIRANKKLGPMSFHYTLGYSMNSEIFFKSLKKPKKFILALFVLASRIRIKLSFWGLPIEYKIFNFLKGKAV